MYAYGDGSSGEGRPYQGYPYINPVINDVATIDAATAARWSALPRTPGNLMRVNEQPGGSRQETPSEDSEDRPYQGYPNINPVMNDVGTMDAATAARWSSLPRTPGYLMRLNEQPGGSRQETPSRIETVEEELDSDGSPAAVKIDYDANPVVYIDLPESSGSEVAEQRRPQAEQSFVQQTIFYDQFKDRTVVTVSDETSSNASSSGSSTHSSGRPNRPTRPAPPVTLSLGPSENAYPSSSSSRGTPGAPPIMSKEASIYGSYAVAEDAFTQSIPERREFPNPPPAYSEYDALSPTPGTPPPIIRQPSSTGPSPSTQNSPQTPGPNSPLPLNPATLPARTQVIVPQTDRKKSKVVYCKYCGINIPSVMVKQTGFATHILALVMFLLGLIPCSIGLYCTNYCRYKNHYCIQCNQLVAYEIPFLCKSLTYFD